MDSSWAQREAEARKPVALGVWQNHKLFLQYADLAETQSSGASASGDYNFFLTHVYLGENLISLPLTHLHLTHQKVVLLCAIESNLEIACGPGKGPKPRHETRTDPASALITNGRRLFLWVLLQGNGSLHFTSQIPCSYHPMLTHSHSHTLSHTHTGT